MAKLFENIVDNLQTKEQKSFKDNEVVVGSGRKDKNSYYIIDGYVKVYDLNADGNIKTIAILKKGDMFPLVWGFDHPPETVYYYKAMGPLETYSVETFELKNELSSNVDVAREAHIAFVYLAWDFMERIKCLQMPYTQEKVLRLLPYLAAKLGKKIDASTYELVYNITQEEIAQLIGATRESVSAHLAKLESRSIINRSRNRLLINMDKVPEEYIHELWFSKAE